MSPIGGVGINLAIQDAVAAANILAGPMARGEDVAPLLAKVQARRMLPTRLTQAMQEVIQNSVIAPLLDDDTAFDRPPWFLRLFANIGSARSREGVYQNV